MINSQEKSIIREDIKPRLMASAIADSPFYQGKEVLEKQNYRIGSLEDYAKLRIQEGPDSEASMFGNWVREGILYVPKKGIFLTKASPIMQTVEDKTENSYLKLTDDKVEELLVNSVELKDRNVITMRFAENPITSYAFGKTAEAYGRFLREAGIFEIPIVFDETDVGFSHIRPLMLEGLGDYEHQTCRKNNNLCIPSSSGLTDGGLKGRINWPGDRVRGIREYLLGPQKDLESQV